MPVSPVYRAAHTKGPWRVFDKSHTECRITYGPHDLVLAKVFDGSEFDSADANARLIAAAPELLATVEAAYVLLGSIRTQWDGRHSAEGQGLLCDLRDAICKATGREAQDVQDDYCNRYLVQP